MKLNLNYKKIFITITIISFFIIIIYLGYFNIKIKEGARSSPPPPPSIPLKCKDKMTKTKFITDEYLQGKIECDALQNNFIDIYEKTKINEFNKQYNQQLQKQESDFLKYINEQNIDNIRDTYKKQFIEITDLNTKINDLKQKQLLLESSTIKV